MTQTARDPSEPWKGPSGINAVWGIACVVIGVIFGAGAFSAWTQASVNRLTDRQSNTFAMVQKLANDLTTAETNLAQSIDAHSTSDRGYTDRATGQSERDEQRDVAELNEKITSLQHGQDDENKTLTSIHDQLQGLQADLKYAIGQKARGDVR